MNRALLPFSMLIVVTVGCAEPLELADWRIDVPPGTPVIELRGVPLQERDPEAVQLVDDLVLGGDDTDPEALFYNPIGIVAADDGRMFVADRGDDRVLMFAPEGTYLGSFGREGQGPGDFGIMVGIAAAGDRIVVDDIRNNRLSEWTLDGQHVADHTPPSRESLLALEDFGDGFVSTYTDLSVTDRRLVVAHHAVDGTVLARLFDVPVPPPRVIRHGPGISNSTTDLVRGSITTLRDYPKVIKAIGTGEVVYLSPAHEYQVVAMDPGGGARWALRVAWPRPALSRSTRQRIVDNAMRSGDVPASVDDFDWPPAEGLEFLRSDGAGRLYVFPTMPREEDEPAGPRMVDVYSPEGELIAAGLVDHIWTHARGDYVYGLRTNDRDEQVAVRYRLTVNGR